MSTPLVSPLPADANPEVAELAAFFNETLGFCPNSVLTMQHRPGIAAPFIQLNKAVMANHGRVSSALKRLIGYVSSLATGCRYARPTPTMLAAGRYGAEQAQLDHIWEYATHPALNAAERAALDFAVAAAAVPNAVNEPLADELRRHWDEGEIVEILGVVSLFGFLNRWNDSMGTTLEPNAVALGEQQLAPRGWAVGKHS